MYSVCTMSSNHIFDGFGCGDKMTARLFRVTPPPFFRSRVGLKCVSIKEIFLVKKLNTDVQGQSDYGYSSARYDFRLQRVLIRILIKEYNHFPILEKSKRFSQKCTLKKTEHNL